MKITELKNLIHEEVRKAVNEAPGQQRDNKVNIKIFIDMLKNPATKKEAISDLLDILNDNKVAAQQFDEVMSHYVDKPYRGE
jgi:hypothetical protein